MANKIIFVLSAKSPEDVKADNLYCAMMGLIENSSLWGLKEKGKESLQVPTHCPIERRYLGVLDKEQQ